MQQYFTRTPTGTYERNTRPILKSDRNMVTMTVLSDSPGSGMMTTSLASSGKNLYDNLALDSLKDDDDF